MTTDCLAGLSQDLLNRAATSIFPAIVSVFGGTSTITNPDVTVTWGLASPPIFDLGQAASTDLVLNLQINVAMTPKDGTQTTATVSAATQTGVVMSPTGTLGFTVKDITFSTQDQFLLAVLNAKKADIAAQATDLLSKIEIPLGPIPGVSFNGFAAGVVGGALYAAGGIDPPTSVPGPLPTGSGFALSLSEALVQSLVRSTWWNSGAPRTFSQDDVTINLDSYTASVSNGKLTLNIAMSGTYNWGAARWLVQIGNGIVSVTMPFAIGPGNTVVLQAGTVSMGMVDLVPDNGWAWMATVTVGPVLAGIDLFINSVLPGAIGAQLARTVYTIQTIPETFGGTTINVAPKNLSLQGIGNTIVVTGDADITAS